MAHIHAKLIAQYALDAAETDTPWERWEFSYKNQEYESLKNHPLWVTGSKYRRKVKAKTILINEYEVPEPHRTPLGIDDVYWTFTAIGGVANRYWTDDSEGRNALNNGFIHLTREAAEKHYEAIKSFTAQEAK